MSTLFMLLWVGALPYFCRWPQLEAPGSGAITLYRDPSFPAALDGDVYAAVMDWEYTLLNQLSTDAIFYGGASSGKVNSISISKAGGRTDELGGIAWVDPKYCDTQKGIYQGAPIIFPLEMWGKICWANCDSTKVNGQSVLRHEIGHFLGLGHAYNPAALMAPVLDQSLRYVDNDAVVGFACVYGYAYPGGPQVSVEPEDNLNPDHPRACPYAYIAFCNVGFPPSGSILDSIVVEVLSYWGGVPMWQRVARWTNVNFRIARRIRIPLDDRWNDPKAPRRFRVKAWQGGLYTEGVSRTFTGVVGSRVCMYQQQAAVSSVASQRGVFGKIVYSSLWLRVSVSEWNGQTVRLQMVNAAGRVVMNSRVSLPARLPLHLPSGTYLLLLLPENGKDVGLWRKVMIP